MRAIFPSSQSRTAGALEGLAPDIAFLDSSERLDVVEFNVLENVNGTLRREMSSSHVTVFLEMVLILSLVFLKCMVLDVSTLLLNLYIL